MSSTSLSRATPKGLGTGLDKPGRCVVHGLKSGGLAAPSARDRSVTTHALPFIELSIGIGENLSALKGSFDEELVLQATLQVPAHHALACRVQAYGTLLAAPDLHASSMTDEDLEFAACLAAPPDIEEQPSFSLTRMASLLERNTLVTPTRGEAAAEANMTGARVSPSLAAQQSTPVMKEAPKVLVSVDDDGSTPRMHRSESVRTKQRKMLLAASDTARRTLGTLLGVGVLLQQLHEAASRQMLQQLHAPAACRDAKRLAAARQLAPALIGLAAGGAPLVSHDEHEQLWERQHHLHHAAQQQQLEGSCVSAAAGGSSMAWGVAARAGGVTQQQPAADTPCPATPEPQQGSAAEGAGFAAAAESAAPVLTVQTLLRRSLSPDRASPLRWSSTLGLASHRVLQTQDSICTAGFEPPTPVGCSRPTPFAESRQQAADAAAGGQAPARGLSVAAAAAAILDVEGGAEGRRSTAGSGGSGGGAEGSPHADQAAGDAAAHARAVQHWQRPVRRLLSIQLVCQPATPRGSDGGAPSPLQWSLLSPAAGGAQ